MFLHWVDLASTNQIKYSLRIYRHSIANTIKFSLTIPNRQTGSHGFICSVWSVFVSISVEHFVLVHSMREDFTHYFMNYELVALRVRERERVSTANGTEKRMKEWIGFGCAPILVGGTDTWIVLVCCNYFVFYWPRYWESGFPNNRPIKSRGFAATRTPRKNRSLQQCYHFE